ncbi:TFIIB-type zinc ribbon-containing protein [Acidilobus sp.]|uniref:TFIIB-type zinc ribbon-containing protein n=1 Tax=Acidilobus sp. TaxID=1872109 RepID=UPI003CFBE6F5
MAVIDVLRCPYCGSERLAWSEETGHLVCQDCGAIIENLIDDRPPRFSEDAQRVVEGPPPRGPLEVALERASAKAVSRGKLVEIVNGAIRFRSPATKHDSEASEALKVIDGFPELKSRTERVKVGLAVYATLKALGVSSSRALSEAARRSGASPKSIESAVRRHRAAFMMYEELVRERLLGPERK